MRSFLLALAIAPTVLAAEPDHAELLRLHNEARARVGAAPLTLGENSSGWARKHSENQAAHGGKCYHSYEVVHPDGRERWSENVASKALRSDGVLVDYTQGEVHRDWMNSPGHRGNLLDPKWRIVGFGMAVGRNGVYWTAVFRE